MGGFLVLQHQRHKKVAKQTEAPAIPAARSIRRGFEGPEGSIISGGNVAKRGERLREIWIQGRAILRSDA